jgi:hypothetical protein
MYVSIFLFLSIILNNFDETIQNVTFIAKANAPFQISALANSSAYQVITLENFGYVCAWKNQLTYYAIVYDNLGNSISGLLTIITFPIAQPARNDYHEFGISALANNRFIVTWEICTGSGTGCAPVFTIYNSDGTKYVTQTAVTSQTGNVPVSAPYYPPPSVITLTDGGFMTSWVYNGNYMIRLYNSSFNAVSLEIEKFPYLQGIVSFYNLTGAGFLVTVLDSSVITFMYYDISGTHLNDVTITVTTGNGPSYSKILNYNNNYMLVYCYIHNSKLNLVNQVYDVNGSAVGPMSTFSKWDTTSIATIPLDFVILKNGLYAVTWTDTINGFIKILDASGANYYFYSFNINSNNVRPKITALTNGGLVGIYGTNQVSATLIDYKGVCSSFSSYFGRVVYNTIAFPIFVPSNNNVIVTQMPQNGQIYKGTAVGQVNQSYSITEVNYVTQSSIETDSFNYKVDKDDITCQVSLTACYKSCKNCEEKGDDKNHKCSSCLTSDNYYPLSDVPQNCFKIDTNLDGYYYSGTDQIFQKCFEACRSCTNTGTADQTNCKTCNKANGYYSLQDISSQCYMNAISLAGYYRDDTNQILGKCYSACKSCTQGGDRKNPNCAECKPGADCTPCTTLVYQDQCYSLCPQGTYLDTSTNSTCIKCTDSDPNCCDKIFYENKCIDSCPDYKVYNSTAKDCYSCSSIGSKYYNSTCVEDCPTGYANENDVCNSCAEKKMYFYNGTCYENCPQDTTPTGGIICSTKSVKQELECNDEICNFHGTCKLLLNQINCECQAGYLGYTCQYTGFDIDDFLSK